MSLGYEDSFGQLMASLQQCRSIYRELIETAQLKKSFIIEGRSNELAELNSRESDLLNQFLQSDRLRREAVAKLQGSKGLPIDEKAALTEVRKILESSEERRLIQEVQEDLGASSTLLQALNEENQLLLKQDMAILSDTLDLFFGPTESEYVYDHPKADASTAKRSKGLDLRM